MEKRKLIIVLLIISGILFFSGCQSANPEISISENDVCSHLTKDECYNSTTCRPTFGSSCRGCEDVVYKGCKSIPESEILIAKENKKYCDATNGTWRYEHYNKPGFCFCPEEGNREWTDGQRYFISGRGCMYIVELCNEMNGTWVEGSFQKSHAKCYINGSDYNFWQNLDHYGKISVTYN